MACAPTANENLWIHTNAVIAHPHSELPFAKGDFSLDMPGVRMLVCVANGLANDPINVITEDGNQLARSTLNDYSVFRLRLCFDSDAELRAERPQCNRQIVIVKCRGTKVLDRIPPLKDGLVCYETPAPRG